MLLHSTGPETLQISREADFACAKARAKSGLKDYDYSQAGAYFITVCALNWKSVFGNVMNGEMRLNKYGRMVEAEWTKTASIRTNVRLNVFVIMPNHLHGIILITNDVFVGATQRVAPTSLLT